MNVGREERLLNFPVKVFRHWKRCPRFLWDLLEIFSSSAGPDLEQLDLLVKLPAEDWTKKQPPRGPCQPNVFCDPLIQKKTVSRGT